jgi:hypothetical protein
MPHGGGARQLPKRPGVLGVWAKRPSLFANQALQPRTWLVDQQLWWRGQNDRQPLRPRSPRRRHIGLARGRAGAVAGLAAEGEVRRDVGVGRRQRQVARRPGRRPAGRERVREPKGHRLEAKPRLSHRDGRRRRGGPPICAAVAGRGQVGELPLQQLPLDLRERRGQQVDPVVRGLRVKRGEQSGHAVRLPRLVQPVRGQDVGGRDDAEGGGEAGDVVAGVLVLQEPLGFCGGGWARRGHAAARVARG